MFCRVYLDSAWRPFLSEVKDAITEYEQELMAAIRERMQPYIEQGRRRSMDVTMEGVEIRLENFLQSVLTDLRGPDETDTTKEPFPDTDGWKEVAENPVHRVRRERRRPGPVITAVDGHRGGSGVRVNLMSGFYFVGHGGMDILGTAEISSGRVSVTLNEDNEG